MLRFLTSHVNGWRSSFGALTLVNGDVVDNNIVDQADLNAVDAALHSMSGDSNWNPRADVNGDGVVDQTDRRTVKNNLGKAGDA